MHYPFMSQAALDAQERDNARFHPDPDAGRHARECCCSRCYPDDPTPVPPSAAEIAAIRAAHATTDAHEDGPPF
ncbi:hypothetical protein [Nocardia tengchongensis]|uniref:hypothetical protein n=1 Tax=Nocardia tengchongensis TaxID=2055889 RepID=UPI00365C4D76